MASHGIVIAALATLVVAGCSPGARSVPCQNDGECSAKDGRYAFCLESRCVECVGRGSCGGSPCVDGVCKIECEKKADCRGDDVCEAGLCKQP